MENSFLLPVTFERKVVSFLEKLHLGEEDAEIISCEDIPNADVVLCISKEEETKEEYTINVEAKIIHYEPRESFKQKKMRIETFFGDILSSTTSFNSTVSLDREEREGEDEYYWETRVNHNV